MSLMGVMMRDLGVPFATSLAAIVFATRIAAQPVPCVVHGTSAMSMPVRVSLDRLDVRIDPSRQWPILLERIEHRGAWAHVRSAQQNGVLEGWVRATDLHRPGFSGHIAMQATDDWCAPEAGEAGTSDIDFAGPARIRVGTAVLSQENGGVWATVREPEGYEVTHVRGSEWVRIVRVRGLNACGAALTHAWVRRADLEVEPALRQASYSDATWPSTSGRVEANDHEVAAQR